MGPELVLRATAAAKAVAVELGLRVDDAVVMANSNKLALRVSPCDVFARVAVAGHEVSAFEVEVVQLLAAASGPVAALEPRVEPSVHEVDGFAITLWIYYEVVSSQVPPVIYADALHRLHAAMRSVEIATPHMMERVAQAVRLVENRVATPGLAVADREFLLSTLQGARLTIHHRGAAEQLLYGEPTRATSSARGMARASSTSRRGAEDPSKSMLRMCRRQSVRATPISITPCSRNAGGSCWQWSQPGRWDAHDQFPNGLEHGRAILTTLRDGPPWA